MTPKIFLITLTILLASHWESKAQSNEDQILGNYFISHQGDESRAKITKTEAGTYQAQIYWLKDTLDKHGNFRLDVKNPDKSLRNIPCNQIVIVTDLVYNAAKNRWDGGKVYDPTRGLKVNGTMWFESENVLMLKGSFMGISETVKWIKE